MSAESAYHGLLYNTTYPSSQGEIRQGQGFPSLLYNPLGFHPLQCFNVGIRSLSHRLLPGNIWNWQTLAHLQIMAISNKWVLGYQDAQSLCSLYSDGFSLKVNPICLLPATKPSQPTTCSHDSEVHRFVGADYRQSQPWKTIRSSLQQEEWNHGRRRKRIRMLSKKTNPLFYLSHS